MKKLFFRSLILVLLAGCSSSRHQGPPSDHFDGRRFFNPFGVAPKSLWEVLKWQFANSKAPWPKSVGDVISSPLPKQIQDKQVALTFINHATVFIQTKSLHILTDPIWSKRSSPVSWAGPERVRTASHAIEDLPGVDLVLISHNHYDHLDLDSIKKIDQVHRPLFLVPLGDGRLLESIGISNFKEMDWNDSYFHAPSQSTIYFTRCNHWSARGVFDRNLSLWGSYFIQTNNKKIYFAGDTGYGSHFDELSKKWGAMDISLLPIGAYEPRWFMKDQHMNPEDAVQAHLDLQSKSSYGIHFGTFQLTDEGLLDPVQDLKKALEKKQIPPQNFTAPEFGKVYQVE